MAETLLVSRIRRPRRDSGLKIKAMLKAATRLFLEHGYAATSMDAVAFEAPVSKRTLYSHFGSKEELFAAIIRDLCAEVLPSSVVEPIDAAEDIEDRLTRIGVAFLSSIYTRKQVRLFRTVISESRNYPEIGRMMFEGPVKASHVVVSRYFAAMTARGALRLEDSEFAAVQFLGMLKTDLHMRLLFNYHVAATADQIEAIARRCSRLFLHGALAPTDGTNQPAARRR